MKKIRLIINIFLLLIIFIANICTTNYLNGLDIIPTNYTNIIYIVLLINYIVLTVLLTRKNTILYVIGVVFSILYFVAFCIANYYLGETNNFLNNSFNSDNSSLNTYYVITNKDNNYDENNISGDLYYYNNMASSSLVIERLVNTFDVNTVEINSVNNMLNGVSNKEIEFAVIEKTSYELIISLDDSLNIKYIYSFDLDKASDKDVFNIYVGGNDFTGTLMDFNMLVTVNTKTKEILMTSFPRDYYIEVFGADGRKDTLSYMGPYGIEISLKSLEQFLDIKIDYYLKIDTNSLVSLVDAVGGITYCSPISFTTTHSLVVDTYVDNTQKLYVKEGCQELNGVETLTVARERNAFPGRDRVRQENCQKIILAIFDRLKSANTLLYYSSILDSLNGLYQTNIPKSMISSLIKNTIVDGNWKFTNISVDGTDAIDYVHLTNQKNWVMNPDMNTVIEAKTKIQGVLSA